MGLCNGQGKKKSEEGVKNAQQKVEISDYQKYILAIAAQQQKDLDFCILCNHEDKRMVFQGLCGHHFHNECASNPKYFNTCQLCNNNILYKSHLQGNASMLEQYEVNASRAAERRKSRDMVQHYRDRKVSHQHPRQSSHDHLEQALEPEKVRKHSGASEKQTFEIIKESDQKINPEQIQERQAATTHQ